MYIQAYLADKYARLGLMDKVAKEFGRIDILVNNAGVQHSAPLDAFHDDDWNGAIDLMLTCPFDLSKQAARLMRENGGHIINILSTSAFQAARNISGYVAAKHGLLGLTRALALELAPAIHVNAVAPGLTDTEMAHEYITEGRRTFLETLTPSGRFSTPEEVAEAVVFLIGSKNIYGQCITVDGGWLCKAA